MGEKKKNINDRKMQVSSANNVKVYNLSTGKSLPEVRRIHEGEKKKFTTVPYVVFHVL